MHLKNFSVLHMENEIMFSPAYDLIMSSFLPGNYKDQY